MAFYFYFYFLEPSLRTLMFPMLGTQHTRLGIVAIGQKMRRDVGWMPIALKIII
jgi:hypothetical protein